jgi:hypothetical protein
MQLRPLGPLSDNHFWQFGGAVGGAMVGRWWCRGGAVCCAVYDLFPFAVSVGDSFPFVASDFAARRLNHWLFSLRRDRPKKLGVTRGPD